MEDRIRVDLHEGVADVRLMRADKMNALDDAMFGALVATGEKLKTQRGVRAVVLSGEGRPSAPAWTREISARWPAGCTASTWRRLPDRARPRRGRPAAPIGLSRR